MNFENEYIFFDKLFENYLFIYLLIVIVGMIIIYWINSITCVKISSDKLK